MRHFVAACALLFLAALFLTTAAVAETTAAVPLRTPQLTTPFETAGTGLAPEVSVRLVVGVDGRVGEVEVLSVEPSTEWDEVFRSSTTEQLSGWRYSPATEDGEAVATPLSFKIQFRALSDRAAAQVTGFLPTYQTQDPASLRENIFALPEVLRRELLERQIELGIAHLTEGKVERFDTPRFRVFTDSGDPQIAETVATNLEASFNALDELFGRGIERKEEPLKIVVFLYDHSESFRSFGTALQHPPPGNGFYSGSGLIAFNREVAHSSHLMSLLLHEATHAYVDRFLTRRGVRLPYWFNEGVAEYVGTSRVKKGELIPGKVLEQTYAVNHLPGGGVHRVQTVAGVRVRQGRQALKNESMSLAALLDAGPDIFYGDQRSVYYSTGWLLVHFLRHGEESWGDDLFPELLLYAVEGYPLREAVETVYGRSIEDLEEPFGRYVRRF